MPTDDAPLIEVENLSKTFVVRPVLGAKRKIEALRNVSVALHRGRALALVGESGSGKSTLGRMIVRHHDPDSGCIRLRGVDIAGQAGAKARRDYGRAVQMVFQDPFSALNPAHTIRHHLIRPLALHQPGGDLNAKMLDILRDVELDPDTTPDKYPHELSGGQRQRVNFARTLAVNAEVIVADEPTSMLDVSIRKSVLGLIRRMKDERGLTVLYITHDIATAQYLAEDTAVMFGGQIVETGPTEAVVNRPQHGYTRLLRTAIPDPHVRLRTDDEGFAGDAAQVRADAARDVSRMVEAVPGHHYALH